MKLRRSLSLHLLPEVALTQESLASLSSYAYIYVSICLSPLLSYFQDECVKLEFVRLSHLFLPNAILYVI